MTNCLLVMRVKKLANKKTKKHNIQVYEELPAGDEG